MLHETLKLLRSRSGMSQETVAKRLNVVRQTVSKWEKGISVPDADMLRRIADLFEVSVSELLGEEESKNLDAVALQLALLNARLENRSRRVRSFLKGSLILAAAGLIVWMILLYGNTIRIPAELPANTFRLTCMLDGNTYIYHIDCDEDMQVMSYGGDPWLHSIVEEGRQQFAQEDAQALMAWIETYFHQRGGAVELETVDYNAKPATKPPVYAESQ